MSLTQIKKAGLDALALDHVFTIGASGSDHYTFQGEGLNGTVNDPTLYLTRGKTYRFENGTGAHPIRIQSTSGASGTAYNTGVTNNAGSGTVIVEVQHDAPDVLYYQCTSHAAMNGILYITGALADGGVTEAKLASNSVSNAKLTNSSVDENKLAINAVVTAKIADDAVTTAKIATNAVTGDGLASNSVNTTHLVDTSVITAKIADDAVTGAKIATNAVGLAALADNAVDTAAIANQAVNASKIADGTITDSKLVGGTITNASIANTTILRGKMANNSVGSTEIMDEAVTLAKLEHGTSSNNGKFLRANNGADPTFETVSTDLVADTSPQLGGNLDTNTNNILLNDSNGSSTNRVVLGTSSDMQIFHDGSHSIIKDTGTGNLMLQSNQIVMESADGGEALAKFIDDGACELNHNNVKQLETTENGIYLPKGCIRGLGSGTRAIIGGALNPSQDVTWNFSFSTNHAGYNNGYVFNVRFVLNHWNTGGSYKYIESMTGGRGNVTGLERVNLINNVGTASSGWTNSHLDYSVSLTGGTINGSGASLFKVTYDADGAPSWTSGYVLEVTHSGQIGTISIT